MIDSEKILAEKLFAVFEKLRDGEFENSGTAKMLHEKDTIFFRARAEEEFVELCGVVDGTHRHSDDFEKDFVLESSQTFYWLALAAIVENKKFIEFEKYFAEKLNQLEKIHRENKIPFIKIFEKDLKECREKGYLKS